DRRRAGAGRPRQVSPDPRPQWLRWAERLQAIAQTGLTYAQGAHDLERYRELRALAVEMAARHLDLPAETVAMGFAGGRGYPTPKVDVRAVVFREERLLLVRERAVSRWPLPGRWGDVGRPPGPGPGAPDVRARGGSDPAHRLRLGLQRERREVRVAVEVVLALGPLQEVHHPVGERGHHDLPAHLEQVVPHQHRQHLLGVPA